MGILKFSSGKKSLYRNRKNMVTIQTKKRVWEYLIVSLLLCNTVLVNADEVKIIYRENKESTYTELVKPTLIHIGASGEDFHPGNEGCGQRIHETDLKIGKLNQTTNALVENDKKIYDKTIEKVDMTTGDNEATFSMMQRDKKAVEGGTITYQSGGGTDGDNTWMSVGNGTTTQKFDTGSVVSTTSNENESLKDVTINGKKYFAAVSIDQQDSLISMDAQVKNQSKKAVALGNQAQANNHNDVALGSGSVTAAAVATRGTTINSEYYGFAGTTPTSTVSIGTKGKERTITNVAAGRVQYDSTDAINGSQLYATNQAIETLAGRINKIGANAAAMAALHPLDFDPDDKWDFAAGVGRYRGVNAVALGAFYRPNEDTMISVSGNLGSGDKMVNAGISLKIGQGNHVSTSRVAMAKEIKELRKEIAEMRSLMQGAPAAAPHNTVSTQIFPDIPANHWAYDYVTELAKKGVVEGYEDGKFFGDRTMTRYEFVALLYRALKRGEVLPKRIVKEFSADLQYFQIDAVERDDQNRPVIERIRVAKPMKNI